METKPGYKTTEFWLTVVANIVIALDLAGAWTYVPNRYAVVAGAIVNAAYAVSRGQAKQGVPYEPGGAGGAAVGDRKRPQRRSRQQTPEAEGGQ